MGRMKQLRVCHTRAPPAHLQKWLIRTGGTWSVFPRVMADVHSAYRSGEAERACALQHERLDPWCGAGDSITLPQRFVSVDPAHVLFSHVIMSLGMW